jgi:hypothetical protein
VRVDRRSPATSPARYRLPPSVPEQKVTFCPRRPAPSRPVVQSPFQSGIRGGAWGPSSRPVTPGWHAFVSNPSARDRPPPAVKFDAWRTFRRRFAPDAASNWPSTSSTATAAAAWVATRGAESARASSPGQSPSRRPCRTAPPRRCCGGSSTAREPRASRSTAWPRAVAIATVRDPSWRQTFTWSRGEWENCYEKRGRARVDAAALDDSRPKR